MARDWGQSCSLDRFEQVKRSKNKLPGVNKNIDDIGNGQKFKLLENKPVNWVIAFQMFSAKQIGLKVIMCWTIMKWNIRTLYGHLSSRYCSITVVDRTSTIIDIYAHLFQMSLMCLWWEIYGFCLLSFCQNERFLSFLSLYIFEENVFIFQFLNAQLCQTNHNCEFHHPKIEK